MRIIISLLSLHTCIDEKNKNKKFNYFMQYIIHIRAKSYNESLIRMLVISLVGIRNPTSIHTKTEE